MKFLLVLTALALSLPAQAKDGREKLVKRIEKACNPIVKEDHTNHAEICRCVSRNLNDQLSLDDLELITRSHEEEPKAEEELQNEKHNDLILMDYQITETCLEHPGWKYGTQPQ
jgi:hypothetical protein